MTPSPVQLSCPKCGEHNLDTQLNANQFRCIYCGFEMAHVDTTPNGGIRGVFGWLKQVGETIGDRYTVKTVLGKGGFGATYLVEDRRVNGKRWALKEIPELLFDDYEVALLSGIDHPAIPIIVDRFNESGMVYLVLKFGGNRTLQSVCRQHGTIPYPTLKPWALQLGNVLEYLHSRTPAIIHRDLKPENVLLDDNDRIMLIDFGIAKESMPNTMTRTLGRAASHGFSPPEQILGTGTDQRSDIYAYAATLYYALTGQIPTPAHDRIAGTPLRAPVELAPGLPPAVNAVLIRALALNLNERPQRIHDMLALLDAPAAPPQHTDFNSRAYPAAASHTAAASPGRAAGPAIAPAPFIPPPPAAQRAGLGLSLVDIGAAVAVLAVLAYVLLTYRTNEEPTPAMATTAIAPAPVATAYSNPAVTPSAPVPAAPTPAYAPAASLSVPPSVPVAAPLPAAVAPAVPVQPTPLPVAAVPPPAPVAVVTPPPSVVAPPAAIVPTAPPAYSAPKRPARTTAQLSPSADDDNAADRYEAAAARSRSARAPAASEEDNGNAGGGGWAIIPGQAQKIR